MLTFSDLKKLAKADGYNLDDKPFKPKDWLNINGWLYIKKHIKTTYARIAYCISSSSNSPADFSFRVVPFGSALTGQVRYTKVFIHAGVNFGNTVDLTTEGCEVLIHSKYQTKLELSEQDFVIYVKSTEGFPWSISCPLFSYSSKGSSTPTKDSSAICDLAVVDHVICDLV